MGLDRKTCRIVADTLSRRSGRNADGATFVYGLVDPRTCRVRYVGKSVCIGARMSAHRAHVAGDGEWYRRRVYNRRTVATWVHELSTAGLRPHLTVLAVVPNGEPAYPVEVAFIEKHDGPDLLNAQRCKLSAGREAHLALLASHRPGHPGSRWTQAVTT